MENTHSSSSGNGSRRSAKRGALARRLKEDSKAKIETGKQSAAEQIDQIADAIDVAGSQLDQDQPTMASYASRLANGAGNFADRLRTSSLEDLGRDMRGMARRNPALFILGGVALGAIVARVMRLSDTSADAATSSEQTDDTSGQSTEGEESRRSAAATDQELNRDESAPSSNARSDMGSDTPSSTATAGDSSVPRTEE